MQMLSRVMKKNFQERNPCWDWNVGRKQVPGCKLLEARLTWFVSMLREKGKKVINK